MFFQSKKESKEEISKFSTKEVLVDVKKAQMEIFLSNGDAHTIEVVGRVYKDLRFLLKHTVDTIEFKEDELKRLLFLQKGIIYYDFKIIKAVLDKNSIKEHHENVLQYYVSE